MKFGGLTSPRVEILKEIRTILKLGFDFVEIGIEWPEGSVDKLAEKASEIKKILQGKNVTPIGHTAWWMDLGDPYGEIRESWVREGIKKISVAQKLGIKLINFHFYSRELEKIKFYPHYRMQILNNFVSSLNQLVSYAKSKNMEVILENGDYKGDIAFKNYLYVVAKVPAVKVHLDVGHAYISGGMEMIKRYLTTFKSRIVHLHLHDNHGQFDEHIPIGDGTIDYIKVIKWLKKINFDRTATFEVFTSKEDARDSMLKIKNMWKKI